MVHGRRQAWSADGGVVSDDAAQGSAAVRTEPGAPLPPNLSSDAFALHSPGSAGIARPTRPSSSR